MLLGNKIRSHRWINRMDLKLTKEVEVGGEKTVKMRVEMKKNVR